jgi:hypothetical protein
MTEKFLSDCEPGRYHQLTGWIGAILQDCQSTLQQCHKEQGEKGNFSQLLHRCRQFRPKGKASEISCSQRFRVVSQDRDNAAIFQAIPSRRYQGG